MKVRTNGVGVAIAAALTGATAGAASAQELTIYHQLSETEVIPVREGFAKYYEEQTGQPIEVTDFFQPGGQLQSTIILEARGNAVRGDVILIPPDSLMTIGDAAPDLLGDYTPPSLDDPEVSPAVRAASLDSPGTIFNLAPYCIAYNTNKVTGDDIPKSWLDILDPKFKNQIGMGDVEQTGGARAPLWFLIKKQGELGPPWGWAFYEELGKQEPRLFSGHGALTDDVSSGELSIGILGYGGIMQATATGAPVSLVLPEEGCGAQPTSIEIVKASEDNPVVTMFIDWFLSKDGQQAMYDGSKAVPVRNDVVMDPQSFEFDPMSPKIEPVESRWVSENMAENVAKFKAALNP
jgi:iron(III) transport system substrate-binding protein